MIDKKIAFTNLLAFTYAYCVFHGLKKYLSPDFLAKYTKRGDVFSGIEVYINEERLLKHLFNDSPFLKKIVGENFGNIARSLGATDEVQPAPIEFFPQSTKDKLIKTATLQAASRAREIARNFIEKEGCCKMLSLSLAVNKKIKRSSGSTAAVFGFQEPETSKTKSSNETIITTTLVSTFLYGKQLSNIEKFINKTSIKIKNDLRICGDKECKILQVYIGGN